jgi:biopolymer transport protein ExbD
MRIKRNAFNVAECDMTPMIDMVFQLVAFFMVVINFEEAQIDERVKLPLDALARPREEARKLELMVNVGFNRDATGQKKHVDPYVFLQGEELSIDAFGKARLPQEAAIAKARGGTKEVDDTTVTIRADSDVPTGQVQELVKMAQEAGYSKFALKAKVGEE